MAWIESHQQLERHPKTHVLMSLMEWDLDTTLGKLHRFWWWVLDFAPTGDLRKFNDAVIGGSVGLTGSSAVKFVKSMIEACWLDRGDGVFRVHDWPHYAGRYLQESKFKRSPEKLEEVKSLYALGCPRTVLGLSELPTNQPDQPTRPTIGERGREDTPDEILTEPQALEQSRNAGVSEDFARWIFQDWHCRGGKDAGGVKVSWAGYAKKRWNRERIEWEAGTHKGKTRPGKATRSEADRDRANTGLEPVKPKYL